MGTMEFPNVHSAVAIQMLLVVQSEKRHTTAVQKLQEDKQGGSHVLQQNQGNVFCKQKVFTTSSPQGTQMTVEVPSSNSTPQLFNISSEKGAQVTVEVHSNNSTPQLFKKISSKKGFQVNGKSKPCLPGLKDQHARKLSEHKSEWDQIWQAQQKMSEKEKNEFVNGLVQPGTTEKNAPANPSSVQPYVEGSWAVNWNGAKCFPPPGICSLPCAFLCRNMAYPWDKSCLKSMPLDLKQFEKLDAYAKKVNAKSSVEELMQALLRVAHTDLEKVRAIWIWISHHIEYDVVGFFDRENLSCNPQDVLQRGKGICEGYSRLFEQMCRIAGVHCMKLSGHSKGYGYKTGQTFKGTEGHAWNAVYLDEKWHLVESTWGSGQVDESCSKFTFRYDEFYFLTHPALFINDHFPDNKNWQLLKPTVALKQFENNLQYKSNFYMLGMLVAHPETSIIQTVNGKVTIVVESRSPVLFMSEVKGAKEYSLMTLNSNGMKLELYPQKTGSHKLQIFAKSPKGPEEIYMDILEYNIECSSIDRNVCFPKELQQPVGPNWFTKKQGILRPSQKGPIIHTDDGCCNLSFILSKDLDILASLHSDSLSEDEGRRHILQQRQGNQINFKIHLPHAGNFAFQIFAKKKSDPGNYNYIFNYLICCPNTKVKWPMFPQNYSNWAEGYELVEPLAAFLPANCNIKFKLKLHSIAKAFVQCEKRCPLSLSKDGYWEGSCSTSGCREIYVEVLKNANHKCYWSILKYEVESQ